MSKKQKHEKEPNHERWLLSYADFITLLFVFFVILYSMSSVDAQKYKAVSEAFNVALGGGKSIIELNGGAGSTDKTGDQKAQETEPQKQENTPPSGNGNQKGEADTMQQLKKELDTYLGQKGMTTSVSSVINERGLEVSLNDAEFFDSGRAEIKPGSREKIIEIGKILSKMQNYVRVEGHTDNRPISTSEFKSNWELSVIRATTVTKLLISEAGIPSSKIAAVGYGEFRPKGDNNTEQGRAQNRRVDIVILDSKYNGAEVNK